ncbi:TetR family transcriptional regulator [Streptomyces camponoticapitis]|uniref:TetR family transcriptional regulator n=1 Tax=Streptomyces camponoticapitis TaxID=1616125 RepID=A0ABQ2EPJ1_9ACTN|nr:TetR/AcrR family transcriptional regulator [Streptomyces camponoticapitis]GGK18768.1 TetR family transcriptional regulator [Streptomyces camponoticapitis]
MTDENGDGDAGGASDTGLPASIEAAWGLRERPTKGRKPGLTLQRIVDTAVTVATTEGLPAVSMGRIAKKLGVSPMSLYRYVAAKDELYVLMQEAIIGDPPAPPAPGTDWRTAMARWAWGMRRIFYENLWALRIPVSSPPATPRMVAWWESGLVALEGTRLDWGEKLSVILMVNGYVRHEATLMADLAAAVTASGRPADAVLAGYGRTIQRLADPARYPSVAEMLASGVMEIPDEPEGPDYEFTFGLERILDGIDVLVRERGGDSGVGGADRT